MCYVPTGYRRCVWAWVGQRFRQIDWCEWGLCFFELHGCLLSSPLVMYVHNECRKYFTDWRKIKHRKPEDAAASSWGLHSKGILYWKHVCELASSLLLTHSPYVGDTWVFATVLCRTCWWMGFAGFWLVAITQWLSCRGRTVLPQFVPPLHSAQKYGARIQ